MTNASKRRDHPRPWHRGSVWGDGPRRILDRNERARWRYQVKCAAHRGKISPKGEWVADELERHLSRDGRCDPSHQTLASGAGVSISTVERTLPAMRDLGLVGWERRLRDAGGRAEQTSNAYELLLPGAPEPHPKPASAPLSRAKILESGFTSNVRVAPIPPVLPGLPAVLPGFKARFAAKVAEERRARLARLTVGVANRG